MAAADLGPMIAKLQGIEGVLDSALAYINDSAARLKAAVEAALANGATAEQLAPVQAELDATVAKADAIALAIATPPTASRR